MTNTLNGWHLRPCWLEDIQETPDWSRVPQGTLVEVRDKAGVGYWQPRYWRYYDSESLSPYTCWRYRDYDGRYVESSQWAACRLVAPPEVKP